MTALLKDLFKTSSAWDEYKLIQNIRKWQDSNYKPLWSALPKTFRLSSDFWDKAQAIHRYTEADKKEHAISAWSIYNQIIITEVTRGTEIQVTTQDRVQVKFDSVPAKKVYIRRIYVNGEEREKTTIPYDKMPKIKKEEELRYLFNVHTHPPQEETGQIFYSYFSSMDVRSFLNSAAIITGLITDNVQFLFKTRQTPSIIIPEDTDITYQYIREKLRMAEYRANFTDKLFVMLDTPDAI